MLVTFLDICVTLVAIINFPNCYHLRIRKYLTRNNLLLTDNFKSNINFSLHILNIYSLLSSCTILHYDLHNTMILLRMHKTEHTSLKPLFVKNRSLLKINYKRSKTCDWKRLIDSHLFNLNIQLQISCYMSKISNT